MGGLGGVTSSTASNAQLACLQQWNLMDIRPDHRQFLALENHPSARRASLGTERVSSQFEWPAIPNTNHLSNAPHMPSFEASTGFEPTASFMHAYDPSDCLQVPDETPSMSGYTSQEIDKWCMYSTPATPFYQSQSLPNMGPMVPPEPYQMFNDLGASDQWLPIANQTSAPLPDPITESFFSLPPSTPYQNTNLYRSTTATTASACSSSPRSFSDPESPPPQWSTSNASDLSNYGIPTGDGYWRCAHPGCASQSLFRRGCDLRKHFNRHRKYLFCRHEGCPQSTQNGFSSKKDRARHEAKHNPGVLCEWRDCKKIFSRVDNMKDHVRRIHRKGEVERG